MNKSINIRNIYTDEECVAIIKKINNLFGDHPHEAYFDGIDGGEQALFVEWEGWKSAPYVEGRIDEMFSPFKIKKFLHRSLSNRQINEVSYMERHRSVSNLLHCVLNSTYETGQYKRYVYLERNE